MGRRKKKFGIPHRRYFLYPDLVSTIQQEFNQLSNDEWTDKRRILTNLKNKYGVPRKKLCIIGLEDGKMTHYMILATQVFMEIFIVYLQTNRKKVLLNTLILILYKRVSIFLILL